MTLYENTLATVLSKGVPSGDRTGTGTRRLFGAQLRFEDVGKQFPLITSKKVHWKSIVHELLWFLKGDTRISTLHENNVTIWDEWALADGTIGPGYGYQWRSWPDYSGGSIDQLANVVKRIQEVPECRRMIVSAWNVGMLDQMALMPCHMFFQFAVIERKLHLQVYIRSNDFFLGAPFNIASYALLLMLMAKTTDTKPGDLVYTVGDLHLYENHIEQAKTQIARFSLPYPVVEIREKKAIDEYTFDDIKLIGYKAHPPIKAEVAV